MSTKTSKSKIKVTDLAKSLDVNNNDIIECLAKLDGNTRKTQASLEPEEISYVMEYYTQNNQVESFDAYFANNVKPESEPEKKPKEKKPAEKKEEKKTEVKAAEPEKPAEKKAEPKAEVKTEVKTEEKKETITSPDRDQDSGSDASDDNSSKTRKKKSSGKSSSKSASSKAKSPKTGDESRNLVWMLLAIASASGIMAAVVSRRGRRP